MPDGVRQAVSIRVGVDSSPQRLKPLCSAHLAAGLKPGPPSRSCMCAPLKLRAGHGRKEGVLICCFPTLPPSLASAHSALGWANLFRACGAWTRKGKGYRLAREAYLAIGSPRARDLVSPSAQSGLRPDLPRPGSTVPGGTRFVAVSAFAMSDIDNHNRWKKSRSS
jgi:hypothetical protein